MGLTNRTLVFGKRIYDWLSTFGTVYRGVLPSGVEPDTAYMLISGSSANFGEKMQFPVMIYQRGTSSIAGVLNIVQSLENAIGEGGLLKIYNNIRFKVDKGSPWYQDAQTGEEMVKGGVVNLEITIY